MTPAYKIRFGGHLWRVEATSFNNNKRVSIWPFYAVKEGSIKPDRGGLQVPLEDVDSFVEAVTEAARSLG
jgi:hypothetical protein